MSAGAYGSQRNERRREEPRESAFEIQRMGDYAVVLMRPEFAERLSDLIEDCCSQGDTQMVAFFRRLRYMSKAQPEPAGRRV